MTMQQAVDIAANGHRVAVVGHNARRFFDEAATIAQTKTTTRAIRRGSGVEAITFDEGGRLTFHRTADGVRGLNLDVAYLTDIRDTNTMDEIAPCFATRPQRIAALI